MKKSFLAVIVTALFLAACGSAPQLESGVIENGEVPQSESTPEVSDNTEFTFAGTAAAPDFPAGLEWLNVDRPLSISQDLRGKIVLLDFWTLGCINCIHVIPDLKRLEAEYPDSLVVIGVHSAKFETEGQLESIRQAVLRYEVEHPVVNDNQFQVWQTFGARAWPTLFLIDPNGNAIGYHAGEGVYEIFQPVIDVMDKEFREADLIDERPLELVLESQTAAPTVLSFPGKVLADEAGERLFIADSNHNRILISTLDGELLQVIGSGVEGFDDGDFSSASFLRPQGMALSEDGKLLYIADLENHAIRLADLENESVTTIAGTGEQAYQYPSGGAGLETALSSPWDILLDGNNLHIAMSGLHQLWVLDLEKDAVDILSGSGREGIDDGPPEQTSLSQPSGFTTDGETLYFTDPESSAIRQIPLEGGDMETIIGTGLFDFGDVDGNYPTALLQHALGIAYYEGKLYVADTYNHKLKVIDPIEKSSQTWSGTGQIGWVDGMPDAAQYAEPSGLSIANGKLYIADTNNHLIRVADLESGEVTTLRLSNLGIAMQTQSTGLEAEQVSGDVQQVASGDGLLRFIFTVPEDYKFNDFGPFTLTWEAVDGEILSLSSEGEQSYQQVGPEFPIEFPILLSAGETTIHAEATVFYCEAENEEFCLVQDVVLDIPIEVIDGVEAGDIEVSYELPALEQ
ncbi:MAG: hypothetical protein DWQ07_11895 [Chloroflexi bacterium]|nr:MAG: hypothetical protein DWQ07_11895 [Chloroflexota bacterium]MBL1196061.1 hypothetical protein [Chloroflexota bacterium]NOH13355.1 redoxin domain-containing protein [Chloroflexota bacterium]